MGLVWDGPVGRGQIGGADGGEARGDEQSRKHGVGRTHGALPSGREASPVKRQAPLSRALSPGQDPTTDLLLARRITRHQTALQGGGLPFTDALSEGLNAQALKALSGWLDRIFSPLVTLWVFLGQVLSANHSCRAAVARLIAHRLARRQSPCSAETGAYCQARKRLPETFFAAVARRTGRTPDADVEPPWLWKRRRVYVYDGSSVSMPDTPANQAEYPQPDTQKRGLGFPLARLAAVFSLACGAVLEPGICRHAGKNRPSCVGHATHSSRDLFRPGDVVLADCLMCAWTEMVMLQQRGVECVCRFTSHRKADFRRGKRLGRGDHLDPVSRAKEAPLHRPPAYEATARFPVDPEECRVRVQPNQSFRIKTYHHRRHVVGCGRVYQGRPGATPSGPLERRTGSALPEANNAEGRVAVQDAGTGAQGHLDAHPGLQPDPHDHRPGGQHTRSSMAIQSWEKSPSSPTALPRVNTTTRLPHGSQDVVGDVLLLPVMMSDFGWRPRLFRSAA